MDLAKTYSKLRSSTGFLVGLSSFIIFWLTISAFTGFDRDHGLINLSLSAEASISLAFFSMLQDRVDQKMQAQLDLLQQMIQKMNERDEQLLKIVADIHEEVETDGLH